MGDSPFQYDFGVLVRFRDRRRGGADDDSQQGGATIDHEGLTGDEAAGVAREIKHGAGNVGNLEVAVEALARANRRGGAFEPIAEVLAVDVFHGEPGASALADAGIEDLGDAGVLHHWYLLAVTER